LPYSIP